MKMQLKKRNQHRKLNKMKKFFDELKRYLMYYMHYGECQINIDLVKILSGDVGNEFCVRHQPIS